MLIGAGNTMDEQKPNESYCRFCNTKLTANVSQVDSEYHASCYERAIREDTDTGISLAMRY